MKLELGKAYFHINAFSNRYIVVPTKKVSNKIECITYREDINLWQTSIVNKQFRISKTKFKNHLIKKAMKSVFNTNWGKLL